MFFAVFVCFVDACGWFALIIDFVCLLVIGFGGFCCVWVCLLVCLIALPVGLLVGCGVCCVSLWLCVLLWCWVCGVASLFV